MHLLAWVQPWWDCRIQLVRTRSRWIKFDEQLAPRVSTVRNAWLSRDSTMASVACDLGILPEDVSELLYIGEKQTLIDVDDATAKIILENQ